VVGFGEEGCEFVPAGLGVPWLSRSQMDDLVRGGLDIPDIAVNVPSEEKQAGKLPDKSSWTASPYAPESISSRVSSHRPVVHCDRVQYIAATAAQTLVDSAIPYQQCLPLKSPNLPRRFR